MCHGKTFNLLDLRGGGLLDGLIQNFVDELSAEREAELHQEGLLLLPHPGTDRHGKGNGVVAKKASLTIGLLWECDD